MIENKTKLLNLVNEVFDNYRVDPMEFASLTDFDKHWDEINEGREIIKKIIMESDHNLSE